MAEAPNYRPKGEATKQRVRELIRQKTPTAAIIARLGVSKSYVTRVRQEVTGKAARDAD